MMIIDLPIVTSHCWVVIIKVLLPLYGGRGFGGYIVDDAVDFGHFVDDAVGDAGEKVVGEACPVGGHGVIAGDGADGDKVAIGAKITHNADAFNIGKYGEALP